MNVQKPQSWVMFTASADTVTPEQLTEALGNTTTDMHPCGIEEVTTSATAESRIYFESHQEPQNFQATIQERLQLFGIPTVRVVRSIVQRENWHENWREYFQPVEIGQRFIVQPSWLKEAGQKSIRIPVFIEPGMAFGTGTHATTQLCLQLAEQYCSRGAQVLDIGTGSGILSIAALKLGAAKAVATDLDHEVRENFLENIQLNRVDAGSAQLVIGELQSAPIGPYDLIFCNMLFSEFMPLLHLLPQRLRDPGGALLLSGLLTTEAAEVETRLTELRLAAIQHVAKDEWSAFAVRHL